MPFEADDFYVGMIAYFSVNVLQRHPRIVTTNITSDDKPRPFICYADDRSMDPAGLAFWTCLTTTFAPNRKTLDRRWLRCPPATGAFATAAPAGDLIVFDAAATFAGPVAAFAACSHAHDRFPGMIRPVLLPDGIAQLKRYVKLRRGLLPPVPSIPAAQARVARARVARAA